MPIATNLIFGTLERGLRGAGIGTDTVRWDIEGGIVPKGTETPAILRLPLSAEDTYGQLVCAHENEKARLVDDKKFEENAALNLLLRNEADAAYAAQVQELGGKVIAVLTQVGINATITKDGYVEIDTTQEQFHEKLQQLKLIKPPHNSNSEDIHKALNVLVLLVNAKDPADAKNPDGSPMNPNDIADALATAHRLIGQLAEKHGLTAAVAALTSTDPRAARQLRELTRPSSPLSARCFE